MLEGLFDCILKKYSSIGSKKYYILLLWTRGALGGVLLELLAFHFLTRHCVRMSRVKVKVDFLETIKAFLYRYIKAFTDPKVVVGSIILLISLPYWLMGLPLPCKQH